MAKRVLTQNQREWLLDEIDDWKRRGLVTADGASDILDLYETPNESSARQHSVAIFVLMAVAALLVGFAVFLLVAFNWQELPSAVKLIIIFSVLIGTYSGGFYLRYAKGHIATSQVVFFLGCLFYGAAIWLIAQIFHLNAHYPDGFWWWAVGVLPFALCLDTLLLHALLVVLLAAWAGTEILGFPGLGLWFFGRFPILPSGAYSLPLLALPGLFWAYRKNSPATVGLYVPLLAWWVILQAFAWRWSDNPILFIGSVGGLLLVLAEAHRDGSRFAIPYRFYGAFLALGTLIPLSYHDFNADAFRFDQGGRGYLLQTAAIVVLTLVVVAVTLFVNTRGFERGTSVDRPVYAFVVRQWLPIALVGLFAFLSFFQDSSDPLVPTILANLAMIAAAFWLMNVGLREDRGRPFAAGVLYFVFWAVLRYVDLFGDFGGMLGAAGMFFLCGLALFAVALYWQRRKKDVQDE